MNACANCQQQKAGLVPYRMPLRGTVRIFCPDCIQTLNGLGMGWSPIERRSETLPVINERRHERPQWLSRLRARDETGRMAS
jgi:hypothetical protein